MKKISKNKQLNDVLQLQQFLLWEASGGKLGSKPDSFSEIPFVERMKFLTIMQNSALIANKIDPKKDTSGLSELRSMMNDPEDVVSLEDGKGENSVGDKNPSRANKPTIANGHGTAASIFAAAAESANYDADGDELPPLQ